MIAGHGIDLVEIDRIRKIIEKHGGRFITKYFDSREKSEAEGLKDQASFFASRFAAKEAFSKAIGTGFAGFGFKDVIVLRENNKPPRLDFSETLKKLFPDIKPEDFILSITHEKGMAAASVIWQKSG